MSDTLQALGWRRFFQQQLSLEDLETLHPARVMEIQRTGLAVRGAEDEYLIPLGGRWFREDAEYRPTVGDWVLLDADCAAVERVLERVSLIKRLSAGSTSEVQLIAANVDTLFIVSSCNDDFNLSRIERIGLSLPCAFSWD